MLIYNFQKEFVGIDEKDLTTLGFSNLGELRSEAADFADLFVKTPGYIHNFKHVHWIDFITCAESNDESKVIINVNNKNYRCILNITTAFLVDNPSSKAYIINLNHLRELTHEESESIAGDIVERDITQGTATDSQTIFNSPLVQESVVETTQENIIDDYDMPLEINIEEDEPLSSVIEDSFDDIPMHIETSFEDDILESSVADPFEMPSNLDEKLEIAFDIEEEDIVTPPSPSPVKELVQESFDNGYIYDPAVASHELGLPVDLIEEFIQDFIDQAKEFKEELYIALNENNLDNLKILSHKLKGVAANLRVEDALEVLTIANTSNDINSIRESLDTFYKIISKLAGEEITVEKVSIDPTQEKASSFLDLPEVELPEEKIEININDEEDDLYSDPIEIDPQAEFPQEEDNNELLDLDLKLEIEPELTTIEEETFPSPLYSKEITAKEIGLDIDSFNTLFDDYIHEANEIIKTLRNAIEAEEFQNCKNEALKLKGMSENMRVNIFTSQLDILTNPNESPKFADVIDDIEKSLEQLSRTGE
jgi:HPt (histidine-containing phosphotransfer) domain-containing protein